MCESKNGQANLTVFEQDQIALRQMMPLDRDSVNTLLNRGSVLLLGAFLIRPSGTLENLVEVREIAVGAVSSPPLASRRTARTPLLPFIVKHCGADSLQIVLFVQPWRYAGFDFD
jgi:hypothetical protein